MEEEKRKKPGTKVIRYRTIHRCQVLADGLYMHAGRLMWCMSPGFLV